MDKTDPNLYVVKVRRHYGQNEATSVIHGPVIRDYAEKYLAMIVQVYQDPDAYYVEKWEQEKFKWPTKWSWC